MCNVRKSFEIMQKLFISSSIISSVKHSFNFICNKNLRSTPINIDQLFTVTTVSSTSMSIFGYQLVHQVLFLSESTH